MRRKVNFLLIPTIISIPLVASCCSSTSDTPTCVFSWEGNSGDIYEPDYKTYSQTDINLSDTLYQYEINENKNEMLAEDGVQTLSEGFNTSINGIWKYSMEIYKIENGFLTFSMSIDNTENGNRYLYMKITNLPYKAELIYFNQNDKTLTFLPVGIEYTSLGYAITEEFWNYMLWVIDIYEFEGGKIISQHTFNWHSGFSPITLDVLESHLKYLAIYPHYFDGVNIIE